MEFYMFHNIDRTLFVRLIGNQGRRDPKEAIQIMGFWIWLEREVVNDLTLVRKMLDFQMKQVNDLCDEAVLCLRCVASENYPFSDCYELSLMPKFVNRNISFKYFYENRDTVMKGVAKTVKEVCVRAFQDILEEYVRGTIYSISVSQGMSLGPPQVTAVENQFHHDNPGKSVLQAPLHIQDKTEGKKVVYDGMVNVTPFVMPTAAKTGKETGDGVQNPAAITPPALAFPQMGGDASFFSNSIEFGTFPNRTPLIGQPSMAAPGNPFQGGFWYPNYVTNPAMQIQSSGFAIDASALMVNTPATAAPQGFFPGTGTVIQQPSYAAVESSGTNQDHFSGIHDFSHIFKSSLSLVDDEDDFPEERTIFLTFSRGYPVSASEIKEFFTKKFGKFIESIHMQEVPEGEQVMFARVVARSPAFVNAVVEGGTAKYKICGKQVWARKYVKNRNPTQPPQVSGPSTSYFALGNLKF